MGVRKKKGGEAAMMGNPRGLVRRGPLLNSAGVHPTFIPE